jgi:hypothetical protein
MGARWIGDDPVDIRRGRIIFDPNFFANDPYVIASISVGF